MFSAQKIILALFSLHFSLIIFMINGMILDAVNLKPLTRISHEHCVKFLVKSNEWQAVTMKTAG